ncbi:hypothetical protein TH25_07570 [Thalassospira profundimaris]|uniref:HTH araC/xylS-type domain-containing protein n=1 Tax=Thalassospira profundimaris TaxID=502049 RepID=A0A367XG11_9PROT|nr:AraC family transcriptional regulator [Thalassospira profundimaris]RCK52349.1 hypothetical protein TH25_07570 [Thalassospira profundimaris]
MTPAEKAVWLIETHIEADAETSPDLTELAEKCSISSRHLMRAFAIATGMSVMRYARARKLSRAAQKLVHPDFARRNILNIALEAGYTSHEAFSRAFRDHFAITPDDLRRRGHLDSLVLQECLRMSDHMIVKIEEPRLEKRDHLRIAGLKRRYSVESSTAIPAQWQQFIPWIGNIDGQSGYETYGVCSNITNDTPTSAQNDKAVYFDYICGVAISATAEITDPELSVIDIAPQTYAVFTHRGHISGIRATTFTIWNDYLPKSNLRPLSAPEFECYGREFDPETGNGGVEIWIPVEKAA